MNSQQKELVKRLIQEDCTTRHLYVEELPDGTCRTCAIGHLALNAGIDKDFFKQPVYDKPMWEGDSNVLNEKSIFMEKLKPVVEAIFNKFGLSEEILSKIQSLNDDGNTPEERRVAILNYIETLTVTE